MSDKIELRLVLEKLPKDVELLGDFIRVDSYGRVQFTSPRYTHPIHNSYYARLPRQIDLNAKGESVDNWVPVDDRVPEDWLGPFIVAFESGSMGVDCTPFKVGVVAWIDGPCPDPYVPPKEPETVGFDEAKEIAKTHMVKRADDDTTFWFVRKGDRLVTLDDRNYPLTLSDLEAQFVVGKRHTEDSDAPT